MITHLLTSRGPAGRVYNSGRTFRFIVLSDGVAQRASSTIPQIVQLTEVNMEFINITFSCLIVAILSSVVMCRPDDALLRRRAQEHLNRVAKFCCGEPQPRLVSQEEIEKETGEDFPKVGYLYPSATVLLRCESTGYCSGTKKCIAKMKEPVSLVFHVVDTVSSSSYFIERTVYNETECECQNNRPK